MLFSFKRPVPQLRLFTRTAAGIFVLLFCWLVGYAGGTVAAVPSIPSNQIPQNRLYRNRICHDALFRTNHGPGSLLLLKLRASKLSNLRDNRRNPLSRMDILTGSMDVRSVFLPDNSIGLNPCGKSFFLLFHISTSPIRAGPAFIS